MINVVVGDPSVPRIILPKDGDGIRAILTNNSDQLMGRKVDVTLNLYVDKSKAKLLNSYRWTFDAHTMPGKSESFDGSFGDEKPSASEYWETTFKVVRILPLTGD